MEILLENMLIEQFLMAVTPMLISHIKSILDAAGFDVRLKNCGTDTSFTIKSGEKEAQFYIYNLLMEIATIDRDENPLRFDHQLKSFNYFAKKSANIISSKLEILFKLFGNDDLKEAIEDITNMADSYQRIRILTVDSSKK